MDCLYVPRPDSNSTMAVEVINQLYRNMDFTKKLDALEDDISTVAL